jgi:Mor family transcriptional regulator
MKKRINPMIRVPKGMSTHPSMTAPAVKILSEFQEMRYSIMSSLTAAGVDKKSIVKSLSGEVDVYKKVKKKKSKESKELTRVRKKHVHLSLVEKNALRKDANKLNVSQLAKKYDVTKNTVLNICRS